MNVLRSSIRRTIAAIAPLDPAEASAQSSVLSWIDSGAPLFRERGPVPPRHLAVYFALLDPDRRRVLQVDHLKAGAWVFPGGHVDTEEPAAAVRREASEELTVDADFLLGDEPLFVTESVTRPPGEHVDVTLWFILRGDSAMALSADPAEFRGLRWVSVDERDDWLGSCYAPDQVARFLTKVSAAID
ncbi:NUDIX domain-containing protein [Actinoplanes sp. NPDC051411]|uniref:NUDIX domain-containing protein n=1 Tax=Actinoplanes sp. NPDC051411 TaxID=3155522 RepID=UPI00343AB73E